MTDPQVVADYLRFCKCMIDNLPQGTKIQYLPLAYDDETNAVLVEALKTEFLPTKVSVFQDYVVLEF